MKESGRSRLGGITRNSGGSSGGGGRQSTKEYPQFEGDTAMALVDELSLEGGEVIIPLHDTEGFELPEEVREEYELPEDTTHFSVESFAPVDVSDFKGIGTAVSVTYEMLQASVQAGVIDDDTLASIDVEPGETVQWRPDYVESTPQSDISMCLNGHHSELIKSTLGDAYKVRVRACPMSQVSAAHERYEYVSFYASDSTQAPLSRERARMTVGNLSQSEFVEWAQQNGFGDKVEE